MKSTTTPWAYTHTFTRHAGARGQYPHTVRLDAGELAYFQAVAREMGLSLEAFIQGYLDDNLPGQRTHREKGHHACPATPLDFIPQGLRRRLARVAAFREMSLRELILDDLQQTIELYEADMIFQPATGGIVADEASFGCLREERAERGEAHR